MPTYTWSKVSILRVSERHTDGHLPSRGQGTLELPNKKVLSTVKSQRSQGLDDNNTF